MLNETWESMARTWNLEKFMKQKESWVNIMKEYEEHPESLTSKCLQCKRACKEDHMSSRFRLCIF